MRLTIVGTLAQLVAAVQSSADLWYELVGETVTRFVIKTGIVAEGGGIPCIFQLTEPVTETAFLAVFVDTANKPVTAIL